MEVPRIGLIHGLVKGPCDGMKLRFNANLGVRWVGVAEKIVCRRIKRTWCLHVFTHFPFCDCGCAMQVQKTPHIAMFRTFRWFFWLSFGCLASCGWGVCFFVPESCKSSLRCVLVKKIPRRIVSHFSSWTDTYHMIVCLKIGYL